MIFQYIMKTLMIIFLLSLSNLLIGQAKIYQLYHINNQRQINPPFGNQHLNSLACNISDNTIIYITQQQYPKNIAYLLKKGSLLTENDSEIQLFTDFGAIKNMFWIKIYNIDYLIFIHGKKICVQKYETVWKDIYYDVCTKQYSSINTSQISSLLMSQSTDNICIYTREILNGTFYHKKYVVYQNGTIKQSNYQFTQNIKKKNHNYQLFKFKKLICFLQFSNKQLRLKLKCYDFERNKSYKFVNLTLNLTQNTSNIKFFVGEQKELLVQITKLSEKKTKILYNITILYDEQLIMINQTVIAQGKYFGQVDFLISANKNIFFGIPQRNFKDYFNIKIFKIINSQVYEYESIPQQLNTIYLQQSLCHNDKKFLVGTKTTNNRITLKIIQKFELQQINRYIYYFLFLIILGIFLSLLSYSLLNHKSEFIFYFKQIKMLILNQLIIFIFLYGTFIIFLFSLDLNNNSEFIQDKQKIKVLDSIFPRLIYYHYFICSLINCLFIIFTQKKLKTQFNHLLFKNGFNLQVLILIKSSCIIIKTTIFGILSICFLNYMQYIFINEKSWLINDLFSLNNQMTSVVITSILFMITLAIITLIVAELSKTYWYTIQIILIMSFMLSIITEYLYLEDNVQKIQLVFICLSPFTIFNIILQSVFALKIKYAKFMQNWSINTLFIIALMQIAISCIIFVILIIKRIRYSSIKQLMRKQINSQSSSLLTINLQSQANNSISLQQDDENNILLSVFIPCKISPYKGFQKKMVLQHINFQGKRNQLISFIDYNNQSKSALMKILINDEKSDSFLQEDLEGKILYSPNLKISFCSDKNVLNEDLNAIQHLSLFLQLKVRKISKKDMKKEVDYMLDQFNITDCDRVKKVKMLSGGNKRKVSLACAFMGNPDVVLLDEPTIGLDIRFKRLFLQNLKILKLNKLIIIGTSNSQEAQLISDKIWIINDGKISNYCKESSKKYFQLTLDFFDKQHFQFCKTIVNRQFAENEIIKYQYSSSQLYRLKLQIYKIKNNKIQYKLQDLIKKMNQKYGKSYNFYFKLIQSKFTVEEFYKYRKIMHENLQQNEVEEISELICKQIIKQNQLEQTYQINESESYYEKQARQILIDLSKIDKKTNNYFEKIQPILYFKMCYIKNQNLLLRQIGFVSIFFWIANITNLSYDNDSDKQRYHFHIRSLFLYSYLMISIMFKSSLDQTHKHLLATIGSHFKYLWIGQFIFNTCYMSAAFFANITLYFLYKSIFETVQQNIIVIYIGSLLYIMNFALCIIVMLLITRNKDMILIIITISIIYPAYILNDIFIINYPTQNIAITLKSIFSFIFFPFSLSNLYEGLMMESANYYYFGVLLYQLAIFIFILVIYQKVITDKKKKKKIINYRQIHNVANDDIIQEQRVVQDLFGVKQVVYGHNVCKKYKNQDKNDPSLRNIYFSCKRGQILTFVGHNGCGKTTLFNIIANKTSKTRGEISLFGKQLEQINCNDLLDTAYCSQEGQIFLNFTVEQNIRFIGLIKHLTQKYLTRFTIKMLRYFKLYNKQKTMIYELSQGQRKKVCIIISLLGFPSLIIYDQPTSSIDSQSKDKILYLMKNYCRMFKSIILITTHNIVQAEDYSSKVAVLKNGILLKMGTPQEMIKHPSQQLYKLIISFNMNQEHLVFHKKKKMVMNMIHSYTYINTIREQGFKCIYGLDLFKINMSLIFSKMLKLFQDGIINGFSLYKYGLEEFVKYNMSVDESHQFINEQNRIKKMLTNQPM